MNRYLICFVIFFLCNAPTASFAQSPGRDAQTPDSIRQNNPQNNPSLPNHESATTTANPQNASDNNAADNNAADNNAADNNAADNNADDNNADDNNADDNNADDNNADDNNADDNNADDNNAADNNADDNNADDNNAADNNAAAPNPSPTVRTRRRTIVNREFDDKEKITLLLNAHCDFPSRNDLLSVSAQAESLLLEIYADESILLSVRMRAVQALSYFSSPQNRETLEDILAHPENVEHLLILIQAIRAYATIAPNDAPKKLETFLSDPSDFVRFITIDSLKTCPGNAALNVLQSQYERETNRFFKTRLKQAIDNHCKKSSCTSP